MRKGFMLQLQNSYFVIMAPCVQSVYAVIPLEHAITYLITLLKYAERK